jgi:hypothetical protein
MVTPAIKMMSDFADLWERSVTDGTPVRAIVDDDPVEFAQAYTGAQWIDKERSRLRSARGGRASRGSPQKSGVFERFQSMPIARSSVLWAHVLTSLVANLTSVVWSSSSSPSSWASAPAPTCWSGSRWPAS